jgi:hypothetical protein
VNAFLHVIWGYNQSLQWRVMGIQPTAAPGVSKVVVYVTTKAPDAKVNAATFYTTPDGKHAIGEGSGVVPFGATPFADVRELLKEHANGASRGAASKDLELVEFADLQCPHCKEAQTTMDQIVKDFPKAHVVFQLLPLVDIHPSAFRAASYGVCVQQLSNDAFFKFADGVFDTQDGLTLSTQETVLRAAAKRAGLDDAAIAACADTEAIKDIVKADIKLAQDAGQWPHASSDRNHYLRSDQAVDPVSGDAGRSGLRRHRRDADAQTRPTHVEHPSQVGELAGASTLGQPVSREN